MRSSYEERIVAALNEEGAEYEYETYEVDYIVKKVYVPDFIFPDKKLMVEAKGYFSPQDRSKMLKVREVLDDGWEVRFVFEKAHNKLTARTNTTYAKWCERHGFLWAEGMIPEEWYS